MVFDNLSYRDISSHTTAAIRNMQEIGRATDTHFVVYLLVFFIPYTYGSQRDAFVQKQIAQDSMKYSFIRIQQYTFTCNKPNATFNRTMHTAIYGSTQCRIMCSSYPCSVVRASMGCRLRKLNSIHNKRASKYAKGRRMNFAGIHACHRCQNLWHAQHLSNRYGKLYSSRIT